MLSPDFWLLPWCVFMCMCHGLVDNFCFTQICIPCEIVYQPSFIQRNFWVEISSQFFREASWFMENVCGAREKWAQTDSSDLMFLIWIIWHTFLTHTSLCCFILYMNSQEEWKSTCVVTSFLSPLLTNSDLYLPPFLWLSLREKSVSKLRGGGT